MNLDPVEGTEIPSGEGPGPWRGGLSLRGKRSLAVGPQGLCVPGDGSFACPSAPLPSLPTQANVVAHKSDEVIGPVALGLSVSSFPRGPEASESPEKSSSLESAGGTFALERTLHHLQVRVGLSGKPLVPDSPILLLQ